VKAFNHIPAPALTTDRQPAGTPNRRALVIAGDIATSDRLASGASRLPRGCRLTFRQAGKAATVPSASASINLPSSITTHVWRRSPTPCGITLDEHEIRVRLYQSSLRRPGTL
jgi:hypothetical protein